MTNTKRAFAALALMGATLTMSGPAYAETPAGTANSRTMAAPTDGALGGLGLGGVADSVCDLLHGMLGPGSSPS